MNPGPERQAGRAATRRLPGWVVLAALVAVVGAIAALILSGVR